MKFVKSFLSFALMILTLFGACIPSYATNGTIESISAESACLIEAQSGKTLYSKQSSKRLPMASTTKIMTAIIALESDIPLDTVISVPSEAAGIEGSSMYLSSGEKITLEELIYGLLLSSANDASVAIAICVGGNIEDFVDMMNKKADELKMTDTHFTNPNGLYDEDHYTSARDLCTLMAYCMQSTEFASISGCKKKIYPKGEDGVRILINHNRLLSSYNGVIAGKTGFTKKSGRCLVSCAERDGLRLIAVTLNAPNDWADHGALYDFGFSNYKRLYLDKVSLTIPVISGQSSEIHVSSSSDSVFLSSQANNSDLEKTIMAPRFVFAPIKAGDRIGTVVYKYNGKIIAELPICADEDVTEAQYRFNLFEWLIDTLKELIWKK